MLLSQNRDDIWSAHAVSRELNLSVRSANAVLDEIGLRDLLTLVDGTTGNLYRYNPSSDELDNTVG